VKLEKRDGTSATYNIAALVDTLVHAIASRD
jgi:hypothetical protein